jgi:hypothetical protein
MKLYYLKYTQENEAYVSADSEEEALQKITDFTSNGGENMHNIRLNECGWSVEGEEGELNEIKKDHPNAQFDTHINEYGTTYQQQDQDFLFYN